MAEALWDDPRLDGFRIEAYAGRVVVSPPPDGGHAVALTGLMRFLFAHGTPGGPLEIVQGIGVALPTGDGEYAIPDLSLVDEDFRDHQGPKNLFPARVFHAVVEITEGNGTDDVEIKPRAYAEAGIPVYVIGDRKNGLVHVFSRPRDGLYQSEDDYRPGEDFVIPGEPAVKVPVDLLLQD